MTQVPSFSSKMKFCFDFRWGDDVGVGVRVDRWDDDAGVRVDTDPDAGEWPRWDGESGVGLEARWDADVGVGGRGDG